MGAFEDRVATTVISAFDALPTKCKPRARSDGTREWVPLSGIVLESTTTDDDDDTLTCVALGTGMKALPSAKLPSAKGLVLHDCHAEIIAIRAFNRFLIEECRKISTDNSYKSRYVCRRFHIAGELREPFEIRPHIRIHFYSSEAPCGDGSMELTMASQSDATPWTIPLPTVDTEPSSDHLRGRGYFSQLGAVRTKPGRADSPKTTVKSCSDKLSLRQATSLLLTPVAYLICPANAYTSTLTLPASEYSHIACSRAFGAGGRMRTLVGRVWPGGYSFQLFRIGTTEIDFAYSKRQAGPATSNLSAVMVRDVGIEVLIGGVLQGRKQFSGVLGASITCKAKIWNGVSTVATEQVIGRQDFSFRQYAELKNAKRMTSRKDVKMEVREALGGWIRTGGDCFEMPSW